MKQVFLVLATKLQFEEWVRNHLSAREPRGLIVDVGEWIGGDGFPRRAVRFSVGNAFKNPGFTHLVQLAKDEELPFMTRVAWKVVEKLVPSERCWSD